MPLAGLQMSSSLADLEKIARCSKMELPHTSIQSPRHAGELDAGVLDKFCAPCATDAFISMICKEHFLQSASLPFAYFALIQNGSHLKDRATSKSELPWICY
ncbi:unnamed protein product [Durusdinium trenchii]|uniref:Uncharacterized protein n=1 Tax=Durusdinium trenchii TaxID=1381693 RepID=A0ABP0LYK0_9DINO